MFFIQKRKLRLLIVAILVIMAAGCAVNKPKLDLAKGRLEPLRIIVSPRPYIKAVGESSGRTVYALNRESQEIDIFVDGQRFNSVGGIGFERSNFQRLSDIGVDADGGLLALDSSLKLLRKYSPEGQYISDFPLTKLVQPELFCVAPDGTLFVYDAAPDELVCISPLDGREMYRFGRFNLQRPQSIDCSKDLLWSHGLMQWQYGVMVPDTRVFTLMGEFLEIMPYPWVVGRGGLFDPGREGMNPISIAVRGNIATLLWEDGIWQMKMLYTGAGDEKQ